MTDCLPNLKWFQGTWAGVEALVAHFKDQVITSSYSLCLSCSLCPFFSGTFVNVITAHCFIALP